MWSSDASRVTLCSVTHRFQDLAVEVVHHHVPAGDGGSLAAQVDVVHVWEHKLDGLFLTGGDSHRV